MQLSRKGWVLPGFKGGSQSNKEVGRCPLNSNYRDYRWLSKSNFDFWKNVKTICSQYKHIYVYCFGKHIMNLLGDKLTPWKKNHELSIPWGLSVVYWPGFVFTKWTKFKSSWLLLEFPSHLGWLFWVIIKEMGMVAMLGAFAACFCYRKASIEQHSWVTCDIPPPTGLPC